MRRRTFIAGLGGAGAVLALPAAAQQGGRLPVVALVFGASPAADMAGPDPVAPLARSFVHGLRDLGWTEGRNIVLERRSAEGVPERAPAIFAELLARGVDVLVVGGARYLQDAAQRATRTIPTVTDFPGDPVAAGLVASLARPGGNLTGVTQSTGPEFYAKGIQLLQEMAPGIGRVAFLATRDLVAEFRDVARPAGVAVIAVEAEGAGQLEAAFASILQERADGLAVAQSPLAFVQFPRIVAFAARARLPAIYAHREVVEGGGLMAYGSNTPGRFRQMAKLADRLLKGARPGDVPVERPTTFELLVNASTAHTLGLAVPTALLARADEVIE